MSSSAPTAAIVPTWITPGCRRGFSGSAVLRTLVDGLAEYYKHLGIPWAEGRAGSGPGDATAAQGGVSR